MSRPLLSAEVALVGQSAEGTFPAGVTGQARAGRMEDGGPAAGSGLPAPAGRLPRSLPCEALASCVFHLLGNNRGTPAPAQPEAYTPPTGGVVEQD